MASIIVGILSIFCFLGAVAAGFITMLMTRAGGPPNLTIGAFAATLGLTTLGGLLAWAATAST